MPPCGLTHSFPCKLVKLPAHISTNQRHCTDPCATSSVWNFRAESQGREKGDKIELAKNGVFLEGITVKGCIRLFPFRNMHQQHICDDVQERQF